MNASDIMLLLGLIIIMSPIIWMVTRTKPKQEGCPECGSSNIHTHQEQDGMQVYETAGGGMGNHATVQEKFIVHHRCFACGHQYKVTMTQSR